MARLEFEGLDEAIEQMELSGRQIAERAPEALEAGAAVLVAAQQAALPSRTGATAAHVKPTPVRGNGADGYSIDVYPQGTRRAKGTRGGRAQRYATVGFVLEYGRSRMAPYPWVTPAFESAVDDITQTMREVLTR